MNNRIKNLLIALIMGICFIPAGTILCTIGFFRYIKTGKHVGEYWVVYVDYLTNTLEKIDNE